ncbi:MAG TPA: hypothetical protein VGG75_26700 [Trebonia sp.]
MNQTVPPGSPATPGTPAARAADRGADSGSPRRWAIMAVLGAASGLALPLGVSALMLATVEGPEWGWASGRTIGLFALAVVLGAVTLQRTLRAASPVIEKELFRSRQFTAATVALLLFFAGFSFFLLGTALFMQNVWHFTALRAGAGIAPAPIVSVGFALSAGPIQSRYGRTLPAVAGTVTMALAAAGTLPPERATTGSAVLNMSRQVSSALLLLLRPRRAVSPDRA